MANGNSLLSRTPWQIRVARAGVLVLFVLFAVVFIWAWPAPHAYRFTAISLIIVIGGTAFVLAGLSDLAGKLRAPHVREEAGEPLILGYVSPHGRAANVQQNVSKAYYAAVLWDLELELKSLGLAFADTRGPLSPVALWPEERRALERVILIARARYYYPKVDLMERESIVDRQMVDGFGESLLSDLLSGIEATGLSLTAMPEREIIVHGYKLQAGSEAMASDPLIASGLVDASATLDPFNDYRTLSDFDISDSAHEMIERSLHIDTSILISGATGSGKTTLAQAIHDNMYEIRDQEQARNFLHAVANHGGHVAEITALGGGSLQRLWMMANPAQTEVPTGFLQELVGTGSKLLCLHVEHQRNNTFRVTAHDPVSGLLA